MKKIYVIGNFFYIESTDGTFKKKQKANVLVTKSSLTGTNYTILFDGQFEEAVEFSNIRDESNAAYASQAVFDTFVDTNLGFNPASGGSGAGRATILLTGSPFANFAALDTAGAANLASLFNSSTQVTVATVTGQAVYEYVGEDTPATYTSRWLVRQNLATLTAADQSLLNSLDGVAENSIPVKTSSGFGDSSLLETTGAVESLKAIETPPAEVKIGGVRLRNSADIIYLQSDLTNNRFFPCGSPFTNSGTSDPVCVNLEDEIDITAANQNLTDTTQTLNTGDTMSFVIQGANSGVGDGRHVDRSFTVDMVTVGTLRLQVFVGTDTTGALLVDQEAALSIGLNTIELVSFPLVMVNQDYFVQYTSLTDNVQIRGTNTLTGQAPFVPFFTVRGWPYSTITLFGNLPNQFDSLTNKIAIGGNDRLLIEDNSDSFNKKWIRASTLNLDPGVAVQDEGTPLATLGTTLNFVGPNVAVTGAGTTKTITITGGGTAPPNPLTNDLRHGLSTQSDPALVDFAALTDVANPTNPITISTGTTTAGQYFHIFSEATHEIETIRDTVLDQIVYQDGASGNIFTKVSNARTESSTDYDSYTIGPLNAGVDEDYVITFTTT